MLFLSNWTVSLRRGLAARCSGTARTTGRVLSRAGAAAEKKAEAVSRANAQAAARVKAEAAAEASDLLQPR